MNTPAMMAAFSVAAPGGGRAPSDGSLAQLGVPATEGASMVAGRADLLGQGANTAASVAQGRLADLLADFDPSGTIGRELAATDTALRQVAAESSESPLLDPAAAELGSAPRVRTLAPGELLPEVEQLDEDLVEVLVDGAQVVVSANGVPAAEGNEVPLEGAPPSVEQATLLEAVISTDPAEQIVADQTVGVETVAASAWSQLIVAAPASVPAADLVARNLLPSVRDFSSGRSANAARPTAPAPAAASLPSHDQVALTARQVTHASSAATSALRPHSTPVAAQSASSGTFDAAPWLAPDPSASAPGEVETVRSSSDRVETGSTARPTSGLRTGPLLLNPSSIAVDVPVEAGDAEAISSRGTDITRPAMSSLRSVRVASPASPNLMATAPEVPVMPGERSITRVDVRVSDGERVLELGVSRETDGYAVEVRAARDFVADIQDLEGDIDAALREDGGEGLASFDATSEDEYESAGSELEEATGADRGDSPVDRPVSDPNRILDRHA